MTVRINRYYPGQLTKDDFFNVKSWDAFDGNSVDITFKDVTRIEKLGDGVRILFNEWETHYFDQSDYSTITIF